MKNMIARYHFSMSKSDFKEKRNSGHFSAQYQNLSIKNLPSTYENFWPLLEKVGGCWGWIYKDMYQDNNKLNKILNHKETKLYHLLDADKIIGYSFICKPNTNLIKHIPQAFNPNSKIIEIDNLGLFPGEEGGGRGGKFFEMFFEILFKEYDYVYWSSRNYHAPTLMSYYKNKLGMNHIGTDYVQDVRPNQFIQNNQQDVA